MADIDDVLSAALKRIAKPGDSTGVTDAIRARVDAGDTGVPANSSGFTSGVGSWLPWVGVIVVAAVVGSAAGASGLVGHPIVHEVLAGASGAIAQHASAELCVDGPVVAKLPAGERVLATARSEDSKWVGLRNPVTLADTVWVPVGQVTVDAGQADLASLPVGGACPVVKVVLDPPPVVAAPVAPPSSGGGGGTPAAPDTTAPTIGKPTSNIDPVCNNTSAYPPAIISVSASDNVGVTGVSISWTGAETGSSSMNPGGTWTYSYHPTSPAKHGGLTFTVRATDAAGNLSAPGSVTIQQLGCVF
jgi:hypothetical protein